jgi:hypothetical protein
MRLGAGVLSGLAVCAISTGTAFAQDGAGLYEPFAQPAGPAVSRDFIGALPAPGRRLAADLSDSQLERGFRVTAADLPARAALPVGAAEGPAQRAEPGAVLGSQGGWLGALALLGFTGFAAVRIARR